MMRRLFLAVTVIAVTVVSTAGQEKRLITETDIMKFVWIAEGQISPDGKQVAFTRVVINEGKDDYETSLWLVPADGSAAPRVLTSGTRDSSPRWSPGGKAIVFVRSTEKDGKPQPPQIFLLGLDGGEARAVTDLVRGAGAPEWSPDGKRIAFSSTMRPEDTAKPTPPKSDVRVITSAVYRANGGGWNEPDRESHVWVTEVKAGGEIAKATQLTSGKYSEDGHAWSPDGAKIYFASTRVDEPYFFQGDSDLYSVPAGGGDISKVASINGSIGGPRPSPDGKWIAFNGTLYGAAERSYDQSDLFVAAADGSGSPRNLTAKYDFDIGGGVGGDQRAPRGGGAGGAIWSADGKSLITVAGEQGSANLIRIDVATSTVTPVYQGAHTVQAYTATPDARTIATVTSTGTNINDLFVLDTASASGAKQITRVNEALFKTIRLSEPEEVWWTSFDGRKIQGWVLHPPDFDKSKQYPFILEIHGGPHAAYGNVFTHEFHWMAAKGYVVLFPNPRGSSNYGQEFGNVIQYHYPGDDFKDLMAGVDMMVKRGYIDQKRMGITGGSGGGLLTNWAVTQTNRFAAAVSMRSIADWSGFWYTADFTQYTPSWFRKAPWEDPADYAARSPITHVANVKTPTMFIDGDDDLRTPPSDGGEMMFRALKYMKIPTVMVRFPGETHELSRSGKPKHRIERLQHILGWFDKYLQGKTVSTYDLAR
jgi:dipeptidyl aminopeptidase/acylaminoacyl peptidase